MEEEREKKSWEVGIVVKSETGDLEVHVNVLRLFRPVYSLQITGPAATRFLRVNIIGQGKVELKELNTYTLEGLIREAETWILNDRQAREDEIIAAQIERDTKSSEYGKGKEPRRTGKTEKTREKRRERNA